ncbi:PilZ domain-containing protein [Bradyrhizobium ottawaense]|uniref:PilZ domain-containing protein n=1 Tax=Bradyrhizobium TaxID=374 RepID=UPI003D9B4E67
MIELRAQQRISVNCLALLQVHGVRGVHPCRVVNLHDHGAALHCSTHHVAAFELVLSLDGFKTTKHCHVVWREGNACGVEFLDRNHASVANVQGPRIA